MKRFSFFLSLAFGLFVTAFSIQSCQKDQMQVAKPSVPDGTVGDRAPLIYGVSVFSMGNPSQLSTLDAGTGNILNSVPVFVLDPLGAPFFLNDLKGVCVVNDQVFVTTGFNAIDAYSNMLIKVNPQTGQAGVISYSPQSLGTVSDIDYDEISGNIYGLANNSNNLVSIGNAGNNWSVYTPMGAIGNILGGYRAKGLTMVRDAAGDRIIVAATLNGGGNTRLFNVPAVPFPAATFLGTVNPINALAAGHCGIGFDINLNSVVINRNANAGFGLNIFPWMNPLPAVSASVFWGAAGVNFEDLSSDLN
jgi:hypothetical protein